ncbi:MAG TPA: Hsp70 family protein [Amycolatopsis sp.]|nr:Hsp70 family protein [Amycolatopsis sp.]
MPYVLGIDIGSSYIKAAIRHTHRSGAGESLVLGAVGDAVPSVLHVDPDGSVLVGEAVEDGGPAERDWVARGFAQRIGDQVPFILGGNAYPAGELLATAISWIIDQAAHEAGEEPEHVAVTQPAEWTRYQLTVLRSALEQFGLGGITLVPELTAAALDYAAERRVDLGEKILVCDLGSSAYRAAVLRRSSRTGFEPLARPERAEPAVGGDPGEAVLAQVRSALGSGLDQLDLAQPGAWQAALALRRECTAAVETLLANPEAVIPVSLPHVRTTVGMTREQLEDRVRPAALEGVELIRRALRAAGVHPWQLGAVLLVGGSAQVPLVRQVIATELHCSAAVAANPKATMARGAAVAALHVVRPDAVSLPPAPRRELTRAGAEPGRAGRGLALLGAEPGAAVVPRSRGEATGDETIVLFPGSSPGQAPQALPDLDEVAEDMPPKPPQELSPLPFDIDHEPVSEQPMWKRIALGGGAVGGIVLVVALVAWFIFGNPLHSTPSEQPAGGVPLTTQPAAPKPESTAPDSAVRTPGP